MGTGACPSGGDARSSHQQETSHTYSFLPPSLSFLKQLRFQCEKGASLLISPLLLLSSSHSGRKETRILLLLPLRICTEGDGTAQLLTELAPATLLALGQHSGSVRGQGGPSSFPQASRELPAPGEGAASQAPPSLAMSSSEDSRGWQKIQNAKSLLASASSIPSEANLTSTAPSGTHPPTHARVRQSGCSLMGLHHWPSAAREAPHQARQNVPNGTTGAREAVCACPL